MRRRGSDAPTAIEKLSPRSLTSDSSSLATLSTNGRRTIVSGVNLEAPRRDLGDVEHLIDEMPKVRRRGGDAIDGRHLARRQVAVDAVLEQLHEADDRVERRAQLVRDVGEEFAFRGVRARDLAVESLELRGSTGDANGLPAFANEAVAEQRDGEETQDPERDSQGPKSSRGRRRASTRACREPRRDGRGDETAQRVAFTDDDRPSPAGDQRGRDRSLGPLHDRTQRRRSRRRGRRDSAAQPLTA